MTDTAISPRMSIKRRQLKTGVLSVFNDRPLEKIVSELRVLGSRAIGAGVTPNEEIATVNIWLKDNMLVFQVMSSETDDEYKHRTRERHDRALIDADIQIQKALERLDATIKRRAELEARIATNRF